MKKILLFMFIILIGFKLLSASELPNKEFYDFFVDSQGSFAIGFSNTKEIKLHAYQNGNFKLIDSDKKYSSISELEQENAKAFSKQYSSVDIFKKYGGFFENTIVMNVQKISDNNYIFSAIKKGSANDIFLGLFNGKTIHEIKLTDITTMFVGEGVSFYYDRGSENIYFPAYIHPLKGKSDGILSICVYNIKSYNYKIFVKVDKGMIYYPYRIPNTNKMIMVTNKSNVYDFVLKEALPSF